MKKILKPLLLALVAAFAISSLAQAQMTPPTRRISVSSSSQSEISAEPQGNVSLNLKLYREGKVSEDIAFLIANGRNSFTIEHMLAASDKPLYLKFEGELLSIDEQTYSLNYIFSQNFEIRTEDSVQYRDGGWRTKIEIKKNSEIVLMKNGNATYTLTVGGELKK